MSSKPPNGLNNPALAPGLGRFLSQRPSPKPGANCDMCSESISHEHSHVVHLDSRRLMCTCRACYLLFTSEGAGGGRYRIVPDRYLTDPHFELSTEMWNRLQIPVDMAFFFHNTALGEVVALYPSPGGATESTLELGAWDEIVADNPLLETLADDVEAALFRKQASTFRCYVVPIDACYELVGRVRRSWKGFDGGQEMWRELEEFFESIEQRCSTVDA